MSDKRNPVSVGRVVERTVGHPSVMLPLGGAGIALASAILLPPVWPILIATVLGCTSVGVGLFRFLNKGDQIVQEIVEQTRKEREQEAHDHEYVRLEKIAELRRKLASDRDTRDEVLLDQLKALDKLFREKSWQEEVGPDWTADILGRYMRSFDIIFTLFERRFDQLRQAETLPPAIKERMLKSAEELLRSIMTRVNDIGEIYTGIQSYINKKIAGVNHADGRELERHVQDLKQLLESAERVETRVQAGTGTLPDQYDEYLNEES